MASKSKFMGGISSTFAMGFLAVGCYLTIWQIQKGNTTQATIAGVSFGFLSVVFAIIAYFYCKNQKAEEPPERAASPYTLICQGLEQKKTHESKTLSEPIPLARSSTFEVA